MGASFRKLQAFCRALLDKVMSRTAVVEKAEADLQKRVAETQDWFREAHKELKAAQGELAKRDVELTMKLADVEKAQETAKNLATAAEAPIPSMRPRCTPRRRNSLHARRSLPPCFAARMQRWRSLSCSGPVS